MRKVARTMDEHELQFKYDSARVVVLRWAFPILLLLSTIPLLEARVSARSVIEAMLVTLMAAFIGSSAQVRATKNGIRVRRFWAWKEIPYSDIDKCRASWLLIVCYVQLRRSRTPWQRIYFIREDTVTQVTATGRHTKLTKFVEEQASHRAPEAAQDSVQPRKEPANRSLVALACCFFGGVAYGFYAHRAWTAPSGLVHSANGPLGRAIAAWRDLSTIVDWPWNLIAASLLLALVFILRFKRSAWGPAVVLGTLLGAVLGRLVMP